MALRIKTFGRSAPVLNSGNEDRIADMQAKLEDDVNAFLSTLNPLKVLDIRQSVQNVGKRSIIVILQTTIVYREE